MERLRAFTLDRYDSLTLDCPDCEEPLYLSAQSGGIKDLGDVIDAVAAHQCDPRVLARLMGDDEEESAS
jgi:hypothetical protein